MSEPTMEQVEEQVGGITERLHHKQIALVRRVLQVADRSLAGRWTKVLDSRSSSVLTSTVFRMRTEQAWAWDGAGFGPFEAEVREQTLMRPGTSHRRRVLFVRFPDLLPMLTQDDERGGGQQLESEFMDPTTGELYGKRLEIAEIEPIPGEILMGGDTPVWIPRGEQSAEALAEKAAAEKAEWDRWMAVAEAAGEQMDYLDRVRAHRPPPR